MAVPPEILDAIEANDAEMDRILTTYEEQIREVIPKIIETVQENQGSDGKLIQAAASAKFVRNLLSSTGDPLVAGLDAFLADAGVAAMDTLRSLPNADQLAKVGKREVATVLNANFKELGKGMAVVAKDLEATLKSELLQMTLVPKSINTVARILSDVVGKSVGQAKTLVTTATAKVQRDLHSQALEEMDEPDPAVLYIGGVIATTRGFCWVLDGLAIKVADLDDLDNNQVGDVVSHGGGWNCRHRLLPITLDFAKEEGIDVASSLQLDAANDEAQAGR